MYKQIYDKIKELLETIEDVEVVNTFNSGNFDAYPAINIVSLSKSRQRKATCLFEEEGNISLVLFQEINSANRGAKNGEDVILNIIDDIDDLFDTNSTLGGLVDDVTLTSAELGYVDRETNHRTYNITLSYKLLKQITN